MIAAGRVPDGVVAAAVEGPAYELLVLFFVHVPFFGQTRHVLLELLHLVLQRALFRLEHVPLLHALVAARLRVPAVLQGASLLL